MRLWFNRGFSLAPIAKAMMAADPSLEVIISVAPNMPVYAGPKETWIEPSLDDEAYVRWVRKQVIDNNIDLLIPTRRRKLLAGADLPCAIHLPANIATIELLEDKYAFANAIVGEWFHLQTLNVESADNLEEMLPKFQVTLGDNVPCLKPRLGVNGHGFWKLTQGSALSHIMNPDARTMHQDLFLAAMRAQEAKSPIPPFVLMEYLPGPEVSLDVLCDLGTILRFVARTKEASHQRLQTSHPLESAARSLVARFCLHGVVNIQFRKAKNGSWKVLEINTRPAGGSVYGEEFGTSLLGDWGGLLSGRLTRETILLPDLDFKIKTTATISLYPESQSS